MEHIYLLLEVLLHVGKHFALLIVAALLCSRRDLQKDLKKILVFSLVLSIISVMRIEFFIKGSFYFYTLQFIGDILAGFFIYKLTRRTFYYALGMYYLMVLMLLPANIVVSILLGDAFYSNVRLTQVYLALVGNVNILAIYFLLKHFKGLSRWIHKVNVHIYLYINVFNISLITVIPLVNRFIIQEHISLFKYGFFFQVLFYSLIMVFALVLVGLQKNYHTNTQSYKLYLSTYYESIKAYMKEDCKHADLYEELSHIEVPFLRGLILRGGVMLRDKGLEVEVLCGELSHVLKTDSNAVMQYLIHVMVNLKHTEGKVLLEVDYKDDLWHFAIHSNLVDKVHDQVPRNNCMTYAYEEVDNQLIQRITFA